MASERENQALAGLLRQRGTWPSGPGAGEACPEPGVLAAYFERTLPDAERGVLEAHLSVCARCVETLATLARTEEAMHATEAAGGKAPGTRWAWLDWRWLAPLGAAAAALVLYVTVRPPSVLAPVASHTTQVAESRSEPAAVGGAKPDAQDAAKSAPAASARPMIATTPPAGPPAAVAGARDELSDLSKQSAATRPAEIVAGAKTQAATESANLAAQAKVTQAANATDNRAAENRNARAEEFAVQRNQANAQGGLTSNASQAAAKPAEAQAGLRAQEAASEGKLAAHNLPAPPAQAPQAVAQEGTAVGRSGVVAPGRTQAQRAVEKAGSEREAADRDAKNKEVERYRVDERAAAKDQMRSEYAELKREAGAASVQIRSADGALLWRANTAGEIEVSRDSGTTWARQFAANAVLVMAVTPEGRACWMASRSGVIVRTEDGATWQRVSIPKGETIASLNATSALRARITAASGRVYETSDGGKSWQLR